MKENLPFGLLGLLLCTVLYYHLCRKAGYTVGKSFWLGMGLAVPGIGLLFLIYLVSVRWPLERQVRELRGSPDASSADDAFDLLEEASRLERKGQIPAALSLYADIQSRFPGTEAGRDAEISLRNLGTSGSSAPRI